MNKQYRRWLCPNKPNIYVGDAEIARGGEGVIIDLGAGYLAKILFKASKEKIAKLKFMARNRRRDHSSRFMDEAFAVPLELLVDIQSGEVEGYVMKKVSDSHPLNTLLKKQTRETIWKGLNKKGLARIISNLFEVVNLAHGQGVMLGDITPQNFMANGRAGITAIDLDSCQIRAGEAFFGCGVGTPFYLPPEITRGKDLNAERKWFHDVFSAACVAYEVYTLGTHICDGIVHGTDGFPPTIVERLELGLWQNSTKRDSSMFITPRPVDPKFEEFGDEVCDLFLRCFDHGYEKPWERPTPSEFRDAFRNLSV